MDGISKTDWERLWSDSGGGVYQSWIFNESCANSGKHPIVFTHREQSKLVAGVIAYEKTISSPIGKKKILEVHGTPLFTDASSAIKILEHIKKDTSPYLYATIAPTLFSSVGELFAKSRYSKVSNHTITIDLKKPESELWQALEKKSIRWGIKTAQNNGLSFVQLKDKSELLKLYDLYSQTASSGGFTPEPKSFLLDLASTSISQIFGVYKKDTLVAGALVFFDKNAKIATLSLTAASDEGLKLQAMPFLYWNIALHAKKNNFAYFDLGGYDPDAGQSEKIHNINKYKERFGGAIVEQQVFSTNRTYPFLRKMLQKARFIRKLYRKS